MCGRKLNANFELQGHGDLYVLHLLPVPVSVFPRLFALHSKFLSFDGGPPEIACERLMCVSCDGLEPCPVCFPAH